MNSLVEWKDKPVKYLRDQVIDQLKYSLTKDHLEIVEFDQLVRIALSTNSKSELLSLIKDLPSKDEIGKKNQEQNIAAYSEEEKMFCIFSGSKKEGGWIPPKHLKVVTLFGGADLDFREAQFGSYLTTISLRCFFGGVNIIVPSEVNVVTKVIGVFGGISNRTQKQITPDSPMIVIEGVAIFSGITIKEKVFEIRKILLGAFSFFKKKSSDTDKSID
jgi:hypothetical protein